MRSASADLPEAAGAPPAAVPAVRPWHLPAAAAVASVLVFLLVSGHLIDDAYITLSYAKNLAFHGHWGLIEDGTANTATSPLNVLVLAAVTFFVRDAVFAAGVVFVARREFWAGIWRTVFAALLVTVPWFGFSWLVLGSAVPDTLVIKLSQPAWGPFGFTNGPLLYWRNFPGATAFSFLPLLVGGLAGVVWLVYYRRGSPTARRLTPFAALAIAGALHYFAYSRLGVPPYHWYYAPSIIGATIFLA